MPLPHGNGPDECLHLMSMISPIDRDLDVVYSPLMVVPFRDLLIQKGLKFVEVPNEEYDSFGCNVLALEPRKCVVIAGNPKIKARSSDSSSPISFISPKRAVSTGKVDL